MKNIRITWNFHRLKLKNAHIVKTKIPQTSHSYNKNMPDRIVPLLETDQNSFDSVQNHIYSFRIFIKRIFFYLTYIVYTESYHKDMNLQIFLSNKVI